jgi:cell wall-associated NlpC family hydrolase
MTTLTPKDIVAAARSLEGVPYLWQGNDPAVGLDCRGFLRATLDRLNYAVGFDRPTDYSHGTDTHALLDCMKEIMDEVAVEDSQPGDFPLFQIRRESFHVGMWSAVSPFWIIHCHAGTLKIVDQPLDPRMGRLVTVFRLRGLSAS